jgi:hypothetical protein
MPILSIEHSLDETVLKLLHRFRKTDPALGHFGAQGFDPILEARRSRRGGVAHTGFLS